GDDHVGVYVGQSDQRRIGIAHRDHFIAILAEDALTHALCVWTIVHQQNAAHCLPEAAGAVGVWSEPSFFFFLASFFACSSAAFFCAACIFFACSCCFSINLCCCFSVSGFALPV